mgnify:CR=1 FL=1
MVYIALEIWIAGLVIMILGYLLTSTEQERKRVVSWRMALAYIFWPISLVAVLLNSLTRTKDSK